MSRQLPAPFRVVALLVLLLGSLAGCQLTPIAERAVVIYDRARMDDAQRVAQILANQGISVEMQVRGPLPLSRSKVTVYDAVRHPERLGTVLDWLAPIGSFEGLADPTRDPAKDIVVWLEAVDTPIDETPATPDAPPEER